MNLIAYTVYDLSSGEIASSGRCEEKYLPQPSATHGVVIGVRAKPNTERVNPVTGELETRAVPQREAWRASLPTPEPDERDVVLEALKAKQGVTLADLAAARKRLKGE